jgi:glutamate racemase
MTIQFMIGIFDSGLGGLTVYKALKERLPQYQYLYLGDNARVPYGNRSNETIYRFTVEAIDFLFEQGCRLIILACNTATAVALRRIQQEYLPSHDSERRVLGVIRPVAEYVSTGAVKKIGVIGTKATIRSHAYEREIRKINPEKEVIEHATPLLVPLIEEGWLANNPVTKKVLRHYLRPLKLAHVESLVLGCTHYLHLFDVIRGIMGHRTEVINPPSIVAECFEKYLLNHPEIEQKLIKSERDQFYLTDTNGKFEEISQKWLNTDTKFSLITLCSLS